MKVMVIKVVSKGLFCGHPAGKPAKTAALYHHPALLQAFLVQMTFKITLLAVIISRAIDNK